MSKLPQKTTPCFGSSSKTLISLRSNLRVLSLFLKHVFVQTLIYTPEINQNPKQKVGKMIGFLWQLKTKGIWCASSVVFQLNNDLSTGCEKQSENKITAIVALALRFFWKITACSGVSCKVCLYFGCPQGGVRNRLFMKSLFDSRFLSYKHCCWDAYLLCAESHLKNIQ